jgi:hypothetical protein
MPIKKAVGQGLGCVVSLLVTSSSLSVKNLRRLLFGGSGIGLPGRFVAIGLRVMVK